MPRPRYENLDPAKKAKLLSAAIQEFGTHGYELGSVNRILETAGLSKGSFYYYFDDKADLAATAFIAAAEPQAMLDQLGRPETVDEFWVELRRVSFERLTLMQSRRAEYQCVARLGGAVMKDPQLSARVMPLFDEGRRRVAAFFQRGQELGALRTDLPLPTLMALIEAVKLAAYQATFPGDRVPTEAEMAAFTDLVLDLGRRLASPAKG